MTNGKITIQDVFDLTSDIRNDIKELRAAYEKTCDRISVLEMWKADLVGKITLIGAIIMFFGSMIIDWIKQKLNV